MRTVRHPITMFVVVVLAVVGIGVGLVSGLPAIAPLRTYGASPLRFQAAFPTGLVGPVRVSSSTAGTVMYAAGTTESRLMFAVSGIDLSVLANGIFGVKQLGNNGGGYTNYAGAGFTSSYLDLTTLLKQARTTFTSGIYTTTRFRVRCGKAHVWVLSRQAASGTSQGATGATGTNGSYAVNVSAAPLTETPRTAYVCEDSEDVVGTDDIWSITAVSPSPQLAKQFVESFKPL
jgi:hypothetical protein